MFVVCPTLNNQQFHNWTPMKPKSKKKALVKIEKLNHKNNSSSLLLPIPSDTSSSLPPQHSITLPEKATSSSQHINFPPSQITSVSQPNTTMKPTMYPRSKQVREKYKKEIIDACQYEVQQIKKKNRKKNCPITSEEISKYAEQIEKQVFAVKSCEEEADSIEYRTQIRALIYNMKDPQNSELRQKILYKKISPQQIAVCDEIYFLSPEKRELQIHNNWNRLIACDRQESGKQEVEALDVETDWDEQISELVEPPNYNLDVLKDIEELLSETPIRKIKQRLEEVKPVKIKQKLIRNLSKVFK